MITVANDTVLHDFWTYHQLLQELLPVDFTLLFCMITFIFGFFLVIFIEDTEEPEKLELS